MPAIPYIQPIPKWITDELESRSNDQARLIKTKPFVILTSPAVVTNNKQNKADIVETFSKETYNGKYEGCVLSSTTDVSKLYHPGKSIIGYDLNGKPIEVDGETDRKLSVPLIVDLQIEEMGENAALKTAKLNIKVFSLKQLEMFELFFLRPGMQVVLEYGNNSDLLDKNIEIKSKMFPKNSWEKFMKEFMRIYSPLDKDWPDVKKEYLKKLEDTKGNYNVWTGKVQEYGFAVDTDGTYNIQLTVSAGNELASQILTQTAKPEGKKAAKIENKNHKSYVAKIAEDIDEKLKDILKDEKTWKNEFFNWDAVNEKSKDNTISKTPYISVRLALKIISSLNIGSNICKGKYNGNVEVIPVSSTKYMMSSDERVIFPGTLPKVIVTEKGEIQISHEKVDDPENPKKQIIKINPGETVKINNYSFNLDDTANIKNFQLPTDITNIELPKNVGNLLNVFISYDSFVSFYKNSIKISDILTDMLSMIQQSMYGFSYLELATPDSNSGPYTGLTIIDRKMLRKVPKIPVYRFKIGPTNSIIHTFSFDFQMSDLMAGQSLYSSQLAIVHADDKIDNKQSDNLKYPESLFANANMSYLQNADKYYSINPVEVKIQKALYKKQQEEKIKEAAKRTEKEKEQLKKEEEKKTTEEVKEIEKSLNTNFVRFKIDNDEKNLIYKDESLLKYYLVKEPEPDTVLVSGVDVRIAIDGISGLSTGDYFHIDGVPEIYNQNGFFQITAVEHGINEEGWLTTITAGWLRKQI